jgi:hypothetical protein
VFQVASFWALLLAYALTFADAGGCDDRSDEFRFRFRFFLPRAGDCPASVAVEMLLQASELIVDCGNGRAEHHLSHDSALGGVRGPSFLLQIDRHGPTVLWQNDLLGCFGRLDSYRLGLLDHPG